MIVTKTILQIKSDIKRLRDNSASELKIALVPTMGALHDGHLSLIQKAQTLADIVIVSIFVNKTQFNEQSDYANYPRQHAEDLLQLEKVGIDVVFTPDDKEIFGPNFAFKIMPTKLADCLCGSSRSGHFDGVALIVSKLFNIIKPDLAIFGEKDFQQLAIIKKLSEDLNLDVEIASGETLRMENGLALSSRNKGLSDQSLAKAAQLFRTLSEIKKEAQQNLEISDLLTKKSQKLLDSGFEKIDYLEIRQEESLELVNKINFDTASRIFVAAYLDGVRLIDNLKI